MSSENCIPVCQIRPDRIAIYNEYIGSYSKRGRNRLSLANLQKEKYRGNMSKASKKSMEGKIVNWGVSLQECRPGVLRNSTGIAKKIVMVTLTLPSEQRHSDKEIKRVALNRILITMKRKWGVDRYIWKAEYQSNENIHFHIICDKFIPMEDLRGSWNTIMSDMGYIDEYEKRSGHRNPPSTHIQVVRDQSRALSYIKKYMSKDQVCRLESGAVWGCSDNLKDLRSPVVGIDNEVNRMVYEAMSDHNNKVIKRDECTLIFGDILELMKSKYGNLYRDYRYDLEENWRRSNGLRLEHTPSSAFVPQAVSPKVSRIGSQAGQCKFIIRGQKPAFQLLLFRSLYIDAPLRVRLPQADGCHIRVMPSIDMVSAPSD